MRTAASALFLAVIWQLAVIGAIPADALDEDEDSFPSLGSPSQAASLESVAAKSSSDPVSLATVLGMDDFFNLHEVGVQACTDAASSCERIYTLEAPIVPAGYTCCTARFRECVKKCGDLLCEFYCEPETCFGWCFCHSHCPDP